MPLNTDYRPERFDEFLGSGTAVKALDAKLNSEDIPHAFLITGPSGCGKTTLARIIATKLEATGHNYTEMDSADFRGIDTVREIRRNMQLSAIGGEKRKLYLLDECHQLTKDAQEALLKALEDTPKHVFFVLATTDPQKLKDTLKRRCIHFEVSPVEEDELTEYLQAITESEEKPVPRKILEDISVESMGSPGKALAILDSIIDLPEGDMKEQLEVKAQQLSSAIELCRALMAKKPWKGIAKIVSGLKQESPERIRRAVLTYCTNTLLNKQSDDAYLIMDSFREPFYDSPYEQLVMACYEVSTAGQ